MLLLMMFLLGWEEKNRVAEAISGHSFGSYKGVTDQIEELL